VIAQKRAELGAIAAPQQSDYAQSEWLKAASPATAARRDTGPGAAHQALAAVGLLDLARSVRERIRGWQSSGLALPPPDYRRVVVAELLRRDAAR